MVTVPDEIHETERVILELLQQHGGCTDACGLRMRIGAPVKNTFCYVVEHRGGQVPIFVPASSDSGREGRALLKRWRVLAPAFHANPGSEEAWRAQIRGT